ncbi:hypothetical protein GCM10010451_48470 [Streptomyces virens]|uniref:Cellulase n=1 Tax=Streptomyces virens TaxID=285572 RepID=A0ABP6PVH5_9ACTN|nr:cellulase [Streptomyces calvus]MBA8976353.1 hypothetical protein [Streptomyces calvus]
MDDFERELTRMLHDTRQHAPFEPRHQRRLYQGIRARRRARLLWRAGGSALAVTGLGAALALLPGTGPETRPADRRPLPATSPTPPPASPAPTTSAPGTSRPPTDATTIPPRDATPSYPPPPSATPGAGLRGGTSSTSAPPPTHATRASSTPADSASAGGG